jgi:hypothetical protein
MKLHLAPDVLNRRLPPSVLPEPKGTRGGGARCQLTFHDRTKISEYPSVISQ